MFETISPLSIIVAAFANMVLGMFWYSEPFFGKQWMKLVGLSKGKMADAKEKMATSMLLGLASSILTVLVIEMLFEITNTSDFAQGYVLMFWVWFGFQFTLILGGSLWEQRPIGLLFINGAYQLASLLLMSTLLIAL